MWKSLILLAVTANTFFITPSEGTSQSKASSSAYSRSSSSHSSSYSSSKSYSCSSSTGNSGCGKPPPKCPKNEVYDICPAPCPPRECGVNIALILCAPSPKPGDPDCKPGCRCADGFLRNRAGACIPEDQCKYDCPKNETLDPCYSSCPPRYCGVNIAAVSCLAIDKCEPACRCSDGYLRNGQGICVLEKDCPKCTKPYEIYDVCPAPCPPRRCDVDERLIRCAAPPNPGDPECEPGCRCADGYVRNPKGICVTRAECPPECGENEIYVDCPPLTCRPQECSQVGYPVPCPIKGPKCPVKPACICDYGYVRNGTTKCIPIKSCPSCGGDTNAVSGCGVNCGRHCSDRNKKEPVACIEICYDNACDCKDGFFYDDNTRKCVPPEQCTPTCGPNEVLSNCSNGGCGPWTCSDVGFPTGCVKRDQKYCKVGCVCKEGYVKNEDNICIPIAECPLKCTGAHEVYDPCPPNCPPQTCESIGRKYFCPLKPANNTKDCKGACRCEKGYFRNKIGECTAEEDCLKCTGPNEYFSCGGACDNVCDTLNEQNQTSCPIVNIQCNRMCYCEKGCARNASNICIPIDQCPASRCGVNERLEECPDWLCTPQSCKELGFPLNCTGLPDDSNAQCPGPPRCVCQYNFVRDESGKCIPKEQCPSCGGDPNARPGCGLNCGRLCSNYDKGPVPCPRICYPNSCDCKKDFVYDENTKRCVYPKECTPVCGNNEVYSDCINGGCQAKNCSQLGKPIPCVKIDPKNCIKGCLCTEGYLRARNGTCVPKDQCDNCNKPHEHYDPCAQDCPPETCESIGRAYDCAKPPPNCKGACRCDKGYYRNKIGECITKKECLKCKGRHEYFSCGSACDNVCETLYKQNQTNCPIKNTKCNPKCYCEEGYARDKNNICIPIDQCPVPTCGENERFVQCPPGLCAPRTCSDLGYPVSCPDLPEGSGCPEPPACLCIENYVRDASGKCIPQEKCPSCGGDPNAISGCGVNCGRLCSNYKRKDVSCPAVCYYNACDCRKGLVLDTNTNKCVHPANCTPICGKNEIYDICANAGCSKRNCSQLGDPDICIDVIQCIGACVCQEGYLRAKNGTCIQESQCPTSSCGVNERLEQCPDWQCTPQSCKELGFPLNCTGLPDDSNAKCPGPPRCVCEYNFVRDESGKCIPKEQCPSCGGDENAVSGCGINCGRLCSNYDKGPVPCPKICKINSCDCKKNFVFDENTKKCVHPKQCTPICGENEIYSECINGGCGAKNCSQLGKPIPCVKMDPKYCIKGCLCQKGYLRASNGVCVPEDQCDQCNKPHEYYDSCAPSCPPQTCESIGRQYKCPITAQYCRGACRCEKGYYRNKIGECISEKDCLKCTGPREYFSCGSACDNVCDTLSEQNQTNCPIVNIQCNRMCYCEKGCARNASNICIPIADCPAPKCKKNERLEECPDWLCSPQTCAQLGFPIACPALSGDSNTTCPGKPACVCDNGYVRNSKGLCIPKHKCPSCGGDSNAISGCGVNCGRLCSNYKKKDVVCPLYCKLNGCDCRKEYVYDSNIKKCVLPQDCTPVCGVNETYDICANGGCQKRNCSQIGEPMLCIDPIKCNGGCVCQEGFLRTKEGTCVPQDECPRKCTGPNEYYSCGGACDNVCAILSKQNQTNCPIVNKKCNPNCYCDKDYARDDNNICIPIKQCGVSCKGDPNAVPGCGVNCGRRCSNYNKGPVACLAICYLNACDCKQNYVYDDNLKTCVQPENCTPVCGKDEVYNTCINGGCQKKNCSDLGKPDICIDPKDCIEGCLCKEGFLRASNGTCIPKDKCPTPVCKKNEVYDRCANGGCNRRKCSELVNPVLCKDPIECIGDCVCVKGYLRNEDGICVPEDQCKPMCKGPHEVFNFCPSTCPPQTCESLERAYVCPIEWGEEPPCQPGCVCEEGFYRNKMGECISEEDCLKCMGPNEYFSCGGACDNVCATLNEQNQTNCRITNVQCNSMCYCEEGYARNASNICIPIKDCPAPRCGPNERFEENPSKLCEPLYCSDLGFPLDCSSVEHPDCEDTPACICQQGYVRDERGICILKSECPSCGGDFNATAGCGINCGNHCSDYGQEVSCILVCYDNACDCRDGFVYDDIIKKCVRYEDCTPTNTTTPPSNVNVTEARARLDKGSIALAGEFLYQLVSSKPDENSVVSGTSVMIPLAQLAIWTNGLILEQLLKLLNLNNKDEIRSVFLELTKSYANQQNVQFEVATKYYANEGYPLSANFKRESKEYFDSDGENLDFKQNDEAANTINDWVKNRTHGKIEELVNKDMFSEATRLVIVNAIYFLSDWVHQFNVNDTETKDFYKRNGETVQVPLMYQKNTFKYGENDKFQALELPYKGNQFSCLIILPRGRDDLLETTEFLRDPDEFSNVYDAMKSEQVQVYLPRIKISKQLDMTEMLKKVNVTAMFDPSNDGIHGLLEKEESLYVTDVVQKAIIEIDEKGTEAAAATAIIFGVTSAMYPPPEIYNFEATHPFLIYLLLNGIPLFCGNYVGEQ